MGADHTALAFEISALNSTVSVEEGLDFEAAFMYSAIRAPSASCTSLGSSLFTRLENYLDLGGLLV